MSIFGDDIQNVIVTAEYVTGKKRKFHQLSFALDRLPEMILALKKRRVEVTFRIGATPVAHIRRLPFPVYCHKVKRQIKWRDEIEADIREIALAVCKIPRFVIRDKRALASGKISSTTTYRQGSMSLDES